MIPWPVETADGLKVRSILYVYDLEDNSDVELAAKQQANLCCLSTKLWKLLIPCAMSWCMNG